MSVFNPSSHSITFASTLGVAPLDPLVVVPLPNLIKGHLLVVQQREESVIVTCGTLL